MVTIPTGNKLQHHGNIRKRFAGKGALHDESLDAFIGDSTLSLDIR